MLKARLLIAMLCVLPLCGCLKRTLSVTTDPPGAIVWINNVEVGRTPLESDFTFYGTYDVRLEREGYEPVITSAVADTPIQEQPGIDILGEAAPVRFHNIVRWHWTLTPLAEQTQPKESVEQALIARANALRARVLLTGPPVPPAPTTAKAAPTLTSERAPEPAPAAKPESTPPPSVPPAPPKTGAETPGWIKGTPLKPSGEPSAPPAPPK